MSIESLAEALDFEYEGGALEIECTSYWADYKIEGDSLNVLSIHYKNGKEIDREIKPKKTFWFRT